MDEKRRAAWESAIVKHNRGEDVPEEEHYALLQENMFQGDATPDVLEEAALFLHYWIPDPDDPIPWLGEAIANHWFRVRDWDRQWQKNRADDVLRTCIGADDYDHWVGLNLIAARLHRKREKFPEVLADWAVNVHEGKLKPPPKERGHKGSPPYAYEDRNGAFFMAENWLNHFGMERAEDRIGVIAGFLKVSESTVQKGLTRWRKSDWRRAPWPTMFPKS